MLVQFDVKSAAPEIKTGLLCVDRSHHMDETLIALKCHAASRQIQDLTSCLRCMVDGLRSMQGKLHGAQKLYLALLCFVPEPDSMAFTLRKPEVRRPVRRGQTCLMVKGYVARCNLHEF